MIKPNRRKFLTLCGGTIAASNLRGEASGEEAHAGQAPDGSTGRERLVEALRELNEAGGIGLSPEEFERSKEYAAGVYREVAAKLRPIELPDDLELPVHFSARGQR